MNMSGARRTTEIAYIALAVALMCICSMIAIPTAVPFTLQTFGLFCVLGILGGGLGSVAVVIYLLLGLVGVPVFSGFGAGAMVFVGPTGGFLVGFLVAAAVFALSTRIIKKHYLGRIVGMLGGQLLCYVTGILWFAYGYAGGSAVGIWGAIGICVAPFLIPDIMKLACAYFVSERVSRVLSRYSASRKQDN